MFCSIINNIKIIKVCHLNKIHGIILISMQTTAFSNPLAAAFFSYLVMFQAFFFFFFFLIRKFLLTEGYRDQYQSAKADIENFFCCTVIEHFEMV